MSVNQFNLVTLSKSWSLQMQ